MKKSIYASEVLQRMDKGHTYTSALGDVLKENPGVDKGTLEKELDQYI